MTDMLLEMVLGSKFPWKPGQALPSSVSWLGWAGALRVELRLSAPGAQTQKRGC